MFWIVKRNYKVIRLDFLYFAFRYVRSLCFISTTISNVPPIISRISRFFTIAVLETKSQCARLAQIIVIRNSYIKTSCHLISINRNRSYFIIAQFYCDFFRCICVTIETIGPYFRTLSIFSVCLCQRNICTFYNSNRTKRGDLRNYRNPG